MGGSKEVVGMSFICLELLLAMSMAEISRFRWVPETKLIILMSSKILNAESNPIQRVMGNSDHGDGKIDSETSLSLRDLRGVLNSKHPINVEKRSVKRDEVDYYMNSTLPVVKTFNHDRKSNVLSHLHLKTNQERLRGFIEKRRRYKRGVDTDTKDRAEKERKITAGDEAEHRWVENAARRRQAKFVRVMNIKSRRKQLKNLQSRELLGGNFGGREGKTITIRRKDGSVSDRANENLHGRLQLQQHDRQLKNKVKKKETCMKVDCDTLAEERREKTVTKHKDPEGRVELHFAGDRKTLRGKEKNRQGSRVKSKRKKGSDEKEKTKESNEETNTDDVQDDNRKVKPRGGTKKSGAKGKSVDKNTGRHDGESSKTTQAKKKTARNETIRKVTSARKESKMSEKTKISVAGKNKKGTITRNDTETRQKSKKGNKLKIESFDGNAVGDKHENDLSFSPILGLGLRSRQRAQSNAMASKRVFKRPITGGYARSRMLTRASSNLYGSSASAEVQRMT